MTSRRHQAATRALNECVRIVRLEIAMGPRAPLTTSSHAAQGPRATIPGGRPTQ